MLRAATFILCLLGSAVAAAPDNMRAPRPIASALHAMRAGNWDRAHAIAVRDGPAAATLIEWYRLRAGRGTVGDVATFVARHGDWPGIARIQRRNETAVVGENPDRIIAYFADQAPQTGAGVLAHARAKTATGQTGDADADVVFAWRSMDLTAAAHGEFIARHGALLTPHHDARLDMLLWRGLLKDAKLMLPLVSKDQRALANARIGLRRKARNVDTLLAKVPDPLIGDAGLAHARYEWRIQKGKTDGAIEILFARSQAGTLGNAAKWAGWRRALARDQMRQGNAKRAYDIATNHGLVKGSNYADLEWLAGYLSLRKLNEPARALHHFDNFRAAVFTPISLGRAGYWRGRAYDALTDKPAAHAAYVDGAEHQTSFYGLLAAQKAGIAPDVALRGAEYFAAWQQAPFANSDLVEVVKLAIAMDNLTLAEIFILHLAKTQTRKGIGQLGDMAVDLGAPHLAVMLGKYGAKRGDVLVRPYYALHPMHKMNLSVSPEMAIAIARRESEFDPNVQSGVGAQGLMQLMPATAKEVALEQGFDHNPANVLADWRYNARLGSAYLAKLARKFDGNVIMIAAGYNAGPSRPIKWMATYGDPRGNTYKMIDWIEHIPFRETRNYVMRVAESLPVYRARMGRDPLPISFDRELIGSTVLALTP